MCSPNWLDKRCPHRQSRSPWACRWWLGTDSRCRPSNHSDPCSRPGRGRRQWQQCSSEIRLVPVGSCSTVMLPPPESVEPTRVAAIFAGEPSVVQKIVGGLGQSPVADTVMLWPGPTVPGPGLNEIPGVCAVPLRLTPRRKMGSRQCLFMGRLNFASVSRIEGGIGLRAYDLRPGDDITIQRNE